MMSFLAYCPECGRTVTIITILTKGHLDQALTEGRDIEVACFVREQRWKLNHQEKLNLQKLRQSGRRA